jgi:MFS family permease/quinol monooxygenase YgiN
VESFAVGVEIAYTGRRPLEATASLGGTSPFSPFRYRLYLALFVASMVSNLGTWMQNIGAAWLMTDLSPSPLMVALLQTAASLPIFLLAMPAGALADIVDRRKLLLLSQGLMLAAAGALGVLALANRASPWLLLGLTFALGIGAALNAPAWQAIIPELVPRSELDAAVALGGINFNLSRALGPALGGLVVSMFGAGPNFILNALSFLGVMVVLYEWKRPKAVNLLPAERVAGAMVAGLRYARHARPLQAVLARTMASIIGASAMWAIIPLIARFRLGLDASGYGFLLGFFGIGAVVGGTVLPAARRATSTDIVAAGATALLACMFVLLGSQRNLRIVQLAMVLGGIAWVCAMTELNVAAQLAVPAWVRGRALACYQVVLQGGLAGASALWGLIAERYGTNDAMLMAAAACAVSLPIIVLFPLAPLARLSLEQAKPAPIPEVGELALESGPVMVAVEYQIEPARALEFERLMRGQVRAIRRRDGAFFWGLFFDTQHPERFVEYWLVEIWIEHVRQHERVTLTDRAILDYARSFHAGGSPPEVFHLVSSEVIERDGSALFRVTPAANGLG